MSHKSIMRLASVALALHCLLACASARDVTRQARTFQWPSFLFGTTESTPAPESALLPFPDQVPRAGHPAWRFHKYNGVRLHPVPIEQVPGLASKNIPVGPQTPEKRFQDLITSLSKFGITNIPSLKDASILLGTSTDKETVDAILELASTEDGLELIKSYLSTSQQQPPAVETSVQSVPQKQYPSTGVYQYPTHTVLPAHAFPITQQPNANLEISNAAVKPSTGFFGRIGSLFSFGENKPEPEPKPEEVRAPAYPKLQPGYQYVPETNGPLYVPSYAVPEPVLYPAPVYQYGLPEEIQQVNGVLPYAPWYNYPSTLVNSYGAQLPYGYSDSQVAASAPVSEVVPAPTNENKEESSNSTPQRVTPYDFHASGKVYTPNQDSSAANIDKPQDLKVAEIAAPATDIQVTQ